jgi:OFA family oxalate/formate antiporter-like MFS transporter
MYRCLLEQCCSQGVRWDSIGNHTFRCLHVLRARAVGAGITYIVAVHTPVKWFDDHRGLATGLVTMAYGGTSALLIPAVRGNVSSHFAGTLVVLGAVAGGMVLLASTVLRDPGQSIADTMVTDNDMTATTWHKIVRTWQFWVLYAVFIIVNSMGLMLIGKAVVFATGLGLSSAIATGAASILALADGAGIVVLGGIADYLGGERTAAGSLVMCGGALAAATIVGTHGFGTAFTLLLGAAAFFRSPVFAIFPTLIGEYYGEEHSSANYAVLYSAKVWGGVIGGAVTSVLVVTLDWSISFRLSAGLIALAGLSLLFLRPVSASSV